MVSSHLHVRDMWIYLNVRGFWLGKQFDSLIKVSHRFVHWQWSSSRCLSKKLVSQKRQWQHDWGCLPSGREFRCPVVDRTCSKSKRPCRPLVKRGSVKVRGGQEGRSWPLKMWCLLAEAAQHSGHLQRPEWGRKRGCRKCHSHFPTFKKECACFAMLLWAVALELPGS